MHTGARAWRRAPCPRTLALARHGFRPSRQLNADDVAKLDARIADARVKFGEVEVFEAQRDKAEYYARIGDKDAALAAFDAVAQKGLSTGQKIDIVMSKVRRGGAAGDAGWGKMWRWPLLRSASRGVWF